MLTSKLPSLKLSFLKSYTFFVNFLLEDFSSIEKSCGHYITRHIIYTSVYLLQSERKNKQSLSVEIIRMTFRILSAIVAMLFTNPVTCEEICRCLTFLVTSLVDFAIWFEEDSAIKFDGKNHAVEILNKLIIEGTTGNASSHSFVDAIARLDYIPCDKELFRLLNERLTVLKSTLEEEDVKIVRCLLHWCGSHKSEHNDNSHVPKDKRYTYELACNLTQLLRNHKRLMNISHENRALYTSVHTKGFVRARYKFIYL